MRADVGHAPGRADVFGLQPPVVVGFVQQPVLQIRPVHQPGRAERAAAHLGPQVQHQRIEAVVEVHALDRVGVRRRAGEQRLGLGRRAGQRFFGKQMAARRQNLLIDGRVQMVRRAVVKHVDALVRQQRLHRVVRLGHAVLLRLPPRQIRVHIRDGGHLGKADAPDSLYVGHADVSHADHAGPELFHTPFCSSPVSLLGDLLYHRRIDGAAQVSSCHFAPQKLRILQDFRDFLLSSCYFPIKALY